MQVFAPSTAIWFLINFQTCYQVLNFSEKLLINRSFIIQKFPMLFSFFLWSYIGGCMVRGICMQDESMCMRACQCTFDRRGAVRHFAIIFHNKFSETQTLKPARGCEHARWRRLWKLHKEQYRTLPSILSCHQYPFGWLLTFLCGRWHLLTTHHRELQYYFV